MKRRNFFGLALGSLLVSRFTPRLQVRDARAREPQQSKTPLLLDKLSGALYAFVVADAMGGSIENNLPEQTKADFTNHDFTRFLPPTKPNKKEPGKGDGRTTDGTLNLEALLGVYTRHQDHLDAYDYADLFVKEITEKKVWIAEKGAEMAPNDRPLWYPERYVYQRNAVNNAEPRTAGVGNWLNEGFQGIVLPVGAVNVGDPWRAYDEVTSFGAAHTESFALEGAGVNAAAYAVAFQKDGTVEAALDAALQVAKDGTRLALEDVLSSVNVSDTQDEFIRKARLAVLPYLQLSPKQLKNILDGTAPNDTPKMLRDRTNIGRPSRIACIENVPIALAALKYGNGDYMKTLKASLFYGRDAESIAAVSTSILAAIKGTSIVPESLRSGVDAANKRNYAETARNFLVVVQAIHRKAAERLTKRAEVL